MRKTHTIQVTIDFDQLTDTKVPQEIAERIDTLIKDEWMSGGGDLMGYDGPLVRTKKVEVID